MVPPPAEKERRCSTRGPETSDRLDVLGGAVALVDLEPVLRMRKRVLAHELIARDLGDDRRRGDRGDLGVALHDRGLLLDDAQGQAVDDDVVRSAAEPAERGEDRALERRGHAERVDLLGRDVSDGDRDRDGVDGCARAPLGEAG